MLSLLSVKPVLHWFYSIKWKVNIFSSLWWYILEDGNNLFFSEPIHESHDPKTVIHVKGSLTTDLQTTLLTSYLLSLFFAYNLFIFLERGQHDTKTKEWKPFGVGSLDPHNPYNQNLLTTDKIFKLRFPKYSKTSGSISSDKTLRRNDTKVKFQSSLF